MVRSIIEDILKSVVGEGATPANEDDGIVPVSRPAPIGESIGVEPVGETSIGVECVGGGGETIGIDEDDIVALDIADDEPLEVLEIFRADEFQDFSLFQWMGETPQRLVKDHLFQHDPKSGEKFSKMVEGAEKD